MAPPPFWDIVCRNLQMDPPRISYASSVGRPPTTSRLPNRRFLILVWALRHAFPESAQTGSRWVLPPCPAGALSVAQVGLSGPFPTSDITLRNTMRPAGWPPPLAKQIGHHLRPRVPAQTEGRTNEQPCRTRFGTGHHRPQSLLFLQDLLLRGYRSISASPSLRPADPHHAKVLHLGGGMNSQRRSSCYAT